VARCDYRQEMGKRILWVAVVGVCACQAPYGSRPAKLYNPPIKPHPVDVEPVEVVHYNETCRTDFHTDPKPAIARIDHRGAVQAISTANITYRTAIKMPKTEPQKLKLIARSVDEWSEALRKDPYDAEATVGLALAYDQLLRKECALRLLARLSDLAGNKNYAAAALRQRDNVVSNKDWFAGYRNEALGKLP
jgi:hypothetical protein